MADSNTSLHFGELNSDEQLFRMRHSAAHILAEAVLEMFPDAKYAIGPPVDDGFYYDFELPRSLTPEDLDALQTRMTQSVSANLSISGEQISKESAREIFINQPYKLELIDDIEDDTVGHFRHGEFQDLCRGGHTETTGQVGAFKLDRIAGAYWRGNENNTMLQRIYGLLFTTQDELDEYQELREQARQNDHRRLGRELDLFSTQEDYGPGLIYWHPKGARLRIEIEDAWKKAHTEGGYDLVFTPHIGRSTLWETSGHLDFFAEGMFSAMDVDGDDYYLKPMNCPFHIQIYKNTLRSYRELPMRLAELGTVYRYERSGVLHGMLRVRGFTQDDAHIICTPEQLDDEVDGVVNFVLELLGLFNFQNVSATLSTRPEKAVGDSAQWDRAEAALKDAIERAGLTYEVEAGGGAFYGPKIDFHLTDTLGRKWQCSTVQFDFNLPERFDMSYVGEDGESHRPFMVHRALFGSIERFIGILIEHYGGAFPLWLAPVQASIIPIADRHLEHAEAVANKLKQAGIRLTIDTAKERMGNKIRRAQLQKVPYMLIIGDREAEADAASVRTRSGEDLGEIVTDNLVEKLITEIRSGQQNIV
ncbi:MAG: threonine--tRNA ligase [Dehalococcoidia bacterium]|nr:threonine--tRNA ligase [Dehalococcoidia bacterium]